MSSRAVAYGSELRSIRMYDGSAAERPGTKGYVGRDNGYGEQERHQGKCEPGQKKSRPERHSYRLPCYEAAHPGGRDHEPTTDLSPILDGPQTPMVPQYAGYVTTMAAVGIAAGKRYRPGDRRRVDAPAPQAVTTPAAIARRATAFDAGAGGIPVSAGSQWVALVRGRLTNCDLRSGWRRTGDDSPDVEHCRT